MSRLLPWLPAVVLFVAGLGLCIHAAHQFVVGATAAYPFLAAGLGSGNLILGALIARDLMKKGAKR